MIRLKNYPPELRNFVTISSFAMNQSHFIQFLSNRQNGAAILTHSETSAAHRNITVILKAWMGIGEHSDPLQHVDIHILEPKDSKNISIQSVRKTLADFNKHASAGHRRALWIPNAERLTIACQNALLKTVEEPPENSYLFLSCHHPFQVLQTIRSRCVKVVLKTPMQSEHNEFSKDHSFLLGRAPQDWLKWVNYVGSKEELAYEIQDVLRDPNLNVQQRERLIRLKSALAGFEPLKVIVERELFH